MKGRRSLFVIHKHFARKRHDDFRLAHGGVLKSWVIPKGLPKRYHVKRLAVRVEDHPMSCADFEGVIPEGHYGAGKMEIRDRGKYTNIRKDKSGKSISFSDGLKEGVLEIYLEGKEYEGGYALVHYRENDWLIFRVKRKPDEK